MLQKHRAPAQAKGVNGPKASRQHNAHSLDFDTAEGMHTRLNGTNAQNAATGRPEAPRGTGVDDLGDLGW